MCSILRAAIVVVYFSIAAVAAPLIALDIPHRIASAPGDFRARITIEPVTTNRFGCLYVTPLTTGDSITRCWSLNGEQESRTFWQDIKHLPAGRYDVSAGVIRNDDSRSTTPTVRIVVIGVGYEPDDTP